MNFFFFHKEIFKSRIWCVKEKNLFIFQSPSPPSKSVFSIPLKAVFRRGRHALVLHSHLTFHYWTFYFNIQCFPMEGSLQQCDNPFVFGSRDPQARWQNTAQYEMKRDCKFFFLQKLNTLVASWFLWITKTISTSVIKLHCVNFGLNQSIEQNPEWR